MAPDGPKDQTNPDSNPWGASEVTRPKDSAEWLKWFDSGVAAGRKDVLDAIKQVAGGGPLVEDLILKIKRHLGQGS